jgi:NADH:ubiquinone oxidoreductase subunit D
MTIILNDETTYEIIGFEEGVSITMLCEDQAAVMEAWSKLTDENLSEFFIEDYGSRMRYWNYKVNGMFTNTDEGTEGITARFLVKHTEMSQEYEMIRQLSAETEQSFDNVRRDREQTDQAIQTLTEEKAALQETVTDLTEQIEQLSDAKEMLEECLLEISEIIYA